ncbi:MAG: hypothetical protein HFH15_01615 [Ruminococcus sp.]|nr:hypothetical protein [Ruminococcus sp.]
MREKLNKLFQRTLKPMGLPPGCRELDFGTGVGHAARHVGIRPVTYEFPERIYEFSKSLDDEIDTFLASVECDRYNENYFDSIINITCNLGITDIDRQAQAHRQACLGIRELQNVELQRLRLEKQAVETQILENEEEEKTYA